MNSQSIWQGVLGEIELTVPASSFNAWFKQTSLELLSDSEAAVVVPNVFVKAQLEKRFHEQILTCLQKNGLASPVVSYRVKTSGRSYKVSREITDEPSLTTAPHTEKIITSTKKIGNLNPRYNFTNFIVGSSNDLAYAACQAVANNPGTKYNPLYLYGGAGLGKTHLMQAVGNEIIRKQPSARVLYTTTETFVNEFLDSIRFKKKGFSEKYRNVDVLIVDDMQFIAGKEKTQD